MRGALPVLLTVDERVLVERRRVVSAGRGLEVGSGTDRLAGQRACFFLTGRSPRMFAK